METRASPSSAVLHVGRGRPVEWDNPQKWSSGIIGKLNETAESVDASVSSKQISTSPRHLLHRPTAPIRAERRWLKRACASEVGGVGVGSEIRVDPIDCSLNFTRSHFPARPLAGKSVVHREGRDHGPQNVAEISWSASGGSTSDGPSVGFETSSTVTKSCRSGGTTLTTAGCAGGSKTGWPTRDIGSWRRRSGS